MKLISFATLSAASLLIIFSLNNRAEALQTWVHSVDMKTPPLVVADSVKVNTITRGIVANSALYKPTIQTVSKVLLKKVFKKAISVTPYGIMFLAANDLISMNDTVGKIEIAPAPESIVSSCSAQHYNIIMDAYNITYSQCQQRQSDFFNDLISDENLMPNPNQALISTYRTMASGAMKGEGTLWRFSVGRSIVKSANFASPPVLDETFIEMPETDFDELLFSDLQPDIFLDADGYPNQDYFPNPKFEAVTAEDKRLMELYEAGLLQHTDPNAANYVSPSEYARIKALYEAANKTPEEESQDLTDAETKPMTQKQHADNQIKSEKRAENSAKSMKDIDLKEMDKTVELDKNENIFEELITNVSDLPEMLPALPNLSGGGGCKTISFSIRGHSATFPDAAGCAKMNEVKEVLGWAFYVIFFYAIYTRLFKEAN